MLFDLLVIMLPSVIPYTLFGENLGAIILAIIACVYLLVNNKEIKIEKRYLFIILSLFSVAILTQVFISPYIESISGCVNYLNILLYYLVLSIAIKDKEKDTVLKYLNIALAVMAIYYIIAQGLYYDVRVYGNIGYANSYALLLLIGMYLNLIRAKDIYTEIIDITYITGILFTGSRSTMILLIVYLALRVKKSIDNKNEEIFKVFLPVVFAIIQYVIYSKMRLTSIIVAPVLIFIYYLITNIKKTKAKKYVLISVLLLSIVLLIFNKSNTFERLKNISINNGSLQERLILFEDASKTILNNPLGNGINMYKYKLYDDASAFYDVKYIHNSLLQTSYDIGVVGGIILIIIFIYGIIIINKSRNKDRILFNGLYISIFIHSLLDFDFSYSTFLIMFIMVIVLSTIDKEDNSVIKIKKSKCLIIIILPILIYLALVEGTLVIAKKTSVDNNFNLSIKLYNFDEKISFMKDSRSYFNKAECYKSLYDENRDISLLENALDALVIANKINPYDPRILWNMAYIYEKLGNDDEVILIRDELLEREKFYFDLYKVYIDYAVRRYDETQDEKYKLLQDSIKEKYIESVRELNPKASYIKNQLLNSSL